MATIYETIQSLGSIITDAITAGNANNVPERIIQNSLIKVSTGKYYEVLPIIVPAETCVIGDELRSTNVQPRKESNAQLTPLTDAPYSITALDRVTEVIGDIVTGTSITPTTGNTESQITAFPVAYDNVADSVKQLSRVIRRRIDWGLQLKNEAIFTPPYDMDSPDLGYARDVILQNKRFLQEEITAYITANFPNIKYSRTKCKQDVGYILDAIAYDITYGGNWQSTRAGLAYFDGRDGTLQIDSTEKTATLAAYGYLKSLLPIVGRNNAVSPVLNSEKTQVRRKGSSTAIATTTDPLMERIIAIITSGPTAGDDVTYPDLTSVSTPVFNASTALTSAKKQIQEDTIDFVNQNFGTFKYNSATCRRDLRLILTDVAYDVALNTNYNGVFSGLAYQRGYNEYNLREQRTETIGAINQAKNLVNISLTSDGSTAVGTYTLDDDGNYVEGSNVYASRNTTSFNEIVDIIENGIDSADAIVYTEPDNLPTASANLAKDLLVLNKDFLVAETIAWIEQQISVGAGIWSGFTYNSDKCARDVGFIIDGITYDILYGGTHAATRIARSYFADDGTAQVYGQEAQTSAAYAQLLSLMQDIVTETTVSPVYNTEELQQTNGSPAGAAETTVINDNMTIITDAITAGNLNSLPATVYPDFRALTDDNLAEAAKTNIDSDRETIIKDVIQYISDTYDTFSYNHAKCERDIGLIIEAAQYDWMIGTNFASIVAAYSYLREQSSKVYGDQKTATLAANEFAKQQALLNVNSNATAIAGINTTWEWVDDMIFSAAAEGGLLSVDNFDCFSAISKIEENEDFIISEAINYTDEKFKDFVFQTTDSTDSLEISDNSWMYLGMPVQFKTLDDSADAVTEAGLTADTTYYVIDKISSNGFKVGQTPTGDPDVDASTISGTVGGFNVEAVYDYDEATCARDLQLYLEAIRWDLQYPNDFSRNYTNNINQFYPGCYKTRLAARYYVNSVIGSQEEDMYYLRNGTGLRLQTLDGLSGDLTPANEFGTSRVTAGAYASLDPGWGPEDQRVWITARSPYVQNLTTFGYAATGQRIDGALHNGGNDSIVSNDFTQVISDGIGAHILNNGRAELVSVFTYYSHIGYLAETGGRIRATNGNNSYGTFGSVAEGVDPDETPVTAVVDNKLQFNATISNVETDANSLLAFEFNHAGNEYTKATFEVFGAGDDEELLAEDFRDDGVNRIRLLDLNDSAGEQGGEGYSIVQNTAQTGSTTSLTLAATDGSASSAYVGMKLIITGGAGVGQYSVIDTYNSGSKVATVVRESDGASGWDHFVPGTTIVSPNGSSTYQVEPNVSFTAPPTDSVATTLHTTGTWNDVYYYTTSAEYTAVTGTTEGDGNNASFDIIRNGSKYIVSVNAGGTGYSRGDEITIAGANLDGATNTHDLVVTVTSINTATGAITDIDYEGNGRSGRWIALNGADDTNCSFSLDGTTWSALALPTSGAGEWFRVASGLIDDGTSTFRPDLAVAVCKDSNNLAVSSDAVTWTARSLPGTFSTGGEKAVAYGNGRFVIVGETDRDVVWSVDGVNFNNESLALPSTGYNRIAYGAGYFVAIKANASTNAVAYSADDGVTWTETTLPATETYQDIAFGNNRFIVVASTNNAGAYSINNGVSWTAVTLPDRDDSSTNSYARINYGQGVFIATADNQGVADLEAFSTVYKSEDGIVWTDLPVATSGSAISGYSAVGFGNPERAGHWITIPGTSTNHIAKTRTGARAKGRVGVASERVFEVRIFDPGSGYYSGSPTLTITDPGRIYDALTTVFTGVGVIAQPTFINRGSGFLTASASIQGASSDGFADFLQDGDFVAVRRLTSRPVDGSNVEFDSLPGQFFKLVNVLSFVGDNEGSYTGFLQLSPQMPVADAPPDKDPVTMRIRFSQVRLTGHDFLDIGTGNFVDSNYPNDPVNTPDQTKETTDSDGGRVFFTATDQDGNFRVGPVFNVEQATGIATLNAEAFNIAGLQELTLGEVTLGGNSAAINEFSTDPFFTANSDSVVPTQRAIKAYIEAQIGGGGASLNVNSVTAGDIFIGTNQITTVSGETININANLNFQGGVLGLPLAYNYFLR